MGTAEFVLCFYTAAPHKVGAALFRVLLCQFRPKTPHGMWLGAVYITFTIMTTISHETWLDSLLPRHSRLTNAVVSIMENVLKEQGVDYLAISGRTKDRRSALEKIARKGYIDPARQMTDITGIRVVVYFESDVQKVSNIIRKAFNVDKENSLDKDSLLATDQIGYRSVHYVCDLGAKRAEIEEYKGLETLKFEFQVRTVLQHAWAELAHDRKYKFSGKLPKDLERKLYLYAGLLEIADKGFDETAHSIDAYSKSLDEQTAKGEFDIEITSLSLEAYVNKWAKDNQIKLRELVLSSDLSDLISELDQFGIRKLSELDRIAIKKYSDVAKKRHHETTIYGLVRDWMLIANWEKFVKNVRFDWIMDDDTILDEFFSREEYEKFQSAFDWADSEELLDGEP